MHVIHFVIFAFDDISEVRIFLFWNYFGIVRFEVMDVVTLPNFHSEDFLFTVCGYEMAPTRDSDTKNCFMSKTTTSESKILVKLLSLVSRTISYQRFFVKNFPGTQKSPNFNRESVIFLAQPAPEPTRHIQSAI